VDDLLESIRLSAAPYGLNLIAAIPASRYDCLAAPSMRVDQIDAHARSIVLVGNGGGALWRAFKEHAARDPGWMRRENPLDDFTRNVIEGSVVSAARSLGARCTTVYPFIGDGPKLNFMELGKLAGLAGPSIVGVVVHPTYGPWIAFRAAILIDADIDAPGPALGCDPCPSCTTRTCISSCPADAVAFPAGWNIPRCLTHRVETEADCANRCHARVGCVLGPEHRYPDDELAYHQGRALRAMRAYYETHIRPQTSR
jgi:epoxyqueuosine reductase